jgi:hypothetical protein
MLQLIETKTIGHKLFHAMAHRSLGGDWAR